MSPVAKKNKQKNADAGPSSKVEKKFISETVSYTSYKAYK